MAVSGMVRNGNLVMYDKQTGSLWLQETGEALEGELARKDWVVVPVDPRLVFDSDQSGKWRRAMDRQALQSWRDSAR